MIEILGNLGDFIGGFGVVATVIYLAFQIRQNTVSTRSATYQSVVADVSEWTLQIGLNPEAKRVFGVGIDDFESLSREEQAQFNFFAGQCGSTLREYSLSIHIRGNRR